MYWLNFYLIFECEEKEKYMEKMTIIEFQFIRQKHPWRIIFQNPLELASSRAFVFACLKNH